MQTRATRGRPSLERRRARPVTFEDRTDDDSDGPWGLKMSQIEELDKVRTPPGDVDFDAVVVGAGFAGMYMLYRLKSSG